MLLLRRYGWLCAIAAAYLYLFPYYPKLQSANELPRVYLVKAMVDDHTFTIDHGIQQWGGTSDLSKFGEHYYQNKAPGASFVVVPFYALVKAIAGPPSLAVTMWLCRFVTGIVPTLALLWLLWGYLARFAPEPATRRLVLVAYALGSMAFTYSVQFYAHQLSAVCIAAAWILGDEVAVRARGLRTMFLVGFLAGLAPVVDYQTAFAGLPLLAYLGVRMRGWSRPELVRAFGYATLAAAIPIALLLYYHQACFGSPFKTGYNFSVSYAADHAHGLLGMTYPKLDAITGTLVAPGNGLVVLCPWLLLALPGGVYLWRRGERALVTTVVTLSLVFLYFVTSLTAWHAGWEVGPRYIVALLPFLLPLVAATFAEWRDRPLWLGGAAGLVLIGLVVYVVSTATLPTWPDGFHDPLYEVAFRLLGDNAVAPNLLSAAGIHGVASVLPLFAGIAALATYVVVRAGAGMRGLVLAAVIAIAGIAAFSLALRHDPGTDAAYARTVYPAVAQ